MKGEKYTTIEIEDKDQILEGLIDILVMHDRLWVVILDAQRRDYDLSDKFTLLTRRENQLCRVIQILKTIIQ